MPVTECISERPERVRRSRQGCVARRNPSRPPEVIARSRELPNGNPMLRLRGHMEVVASVKRFRAEVSRATR
jgi:hypothetical protein